MPAAKLFILLNAKSGNRDHEATQSIIHSELQQAGREYELILIDDASGLEQLARTTLPRVLACNGILVIAGGDGAINAIAQAIAGSGCPLGILPHGTFNYFSRVHGIPSDTQAALQLILEDHREAVQTGLINRRVFLVNASIGLYPQLLEDREHYKNKFGRSRVVAFIAGLVSVFSQHRLLRLSLEENSGPSQGQHSSRKNQPGRVHRLLTQTLFVGNNSLQMEQVGIPLADSIRKDQLAAVILKPVTKFSMLLLVLRGVFSKLGESDSVSSFGFRDMTVRSSFFSRYRPIKIATDGEIAWQQSPLVFKVWPDSLILLKASKPDAAEQAVGDASESAHLA